MDHHDAKLEHSQKVATAMAESGHHRDEGAILGQIIKRERFDRQNINRILVLQDDI